MTDELWEFDRELRGLLSSLSKLLADIAGQHTTQNANSLGYWGKMDIEPFDVPAQLQDLQSQLERLQPHRGLLVAFERDDPLPWLSQHDDDAEFPGSSPAYEFLAALRSNRRGSLRAAVVEAASQCSTHLRAAAQRNDLHAVAKQWRDVLDDVVGSGQQMSHRLDGEMVAVTAQNNWQQLNNGEPIEEHRQQGDEQKLDGPCGNRRWRHDGKETEAVMQPKTFLLAGYLHGRLNTRVDIQHLQSLPQFADTDLPSICAQGRKIKRFFAENAVPLTVETSKRDRYLVMTRTQKSR